MKSKDKELQEFLFDTFQIPEKEFVKLTPEHKELWINSFTFANWKLQKSLKKLTEAFEEEAVPALREVTKTINDFIEKVKHIKK